MDGVTTSGGVSLTAPDVLYLEADLSQRIKVDGVRLYASDLSKSANVKFYYKNESTDSYTILSTSSGSYYHTTIPAPSAPRYVRATISGVNIDLYEFQIFNDDYIVAFGEDGALLAEYLDDTPVGSTGTPEAIALFNNSSLLTGMAADAYTTIDYTGNDGDNYVKIASSQNGTYCGIDDGVLIESNDLNETIRWSMGAFDNTEVSGSSVIPTTATGTYTTPIFELNNKYNSSYFITEGTASSGTGSISYDENVYNGTIRVRSSDIAPANISEAFVVDYTLHVTNDVRTYQWIPTTNYYATWKSHASGHTSYRGGSVAVNRRNLQVAVQHFLYESAAWADSVIRIYDRAGNLIQSSSHDPSGLWAYQLNVAFEFDKYGGLWGYGNAEGGNSNLLKILVHFDSALGMEYSLEESGIDFVHALAVEMDGDGAWYTDKIDDLLIHRNTIGTLLHSIALNEPRAVCGTLDNGCWVADNADKKFYRYNSNGSRIKTVTIPVNPAYNDAEADKMTTDYEDGFWYLQSDYVYHVTSVGSVDIGPVYIDTDPYEIRGSHDGCYVICSYTNNKLYFIDRTVGAVTKSQSIDSSIRPMFGVASYDVSASLEFKDTDNILPAPYDSVWGAGGSLEWEEVRKDGYFLPKYKYHQIEVTLRGDAVMNKILMPPAIKTEDIQPQQSKNIYIKTDIPAGADITDYSTRLKTWWGVEA
jgi:hypothetical protein